MARAAASSSGDVVYRTCPLCEAKCGIAVEVDRSAGRVVTIRGDDEDPFSRGYICPKAYGLKAPPRGSRTACAGPCAARPRAGRRSAGTRRSRSRPRGCAACATRTAPRRSRATSATRTPTTSAPRSICRRSCARSAPSDASRRRASISCRRWSSSAAMFGAPLTIPVPDLDRTAIPARARREPARVERQPDDGARTRPGACAGSASAAGSSSSSIRAAPRRRSSPTSTSSSGPAATPSSCSRSCTCSSRRASPRPGRLEASLRGLEALRTLAKDFSPEAVAQAHRHRRCRSRAGSRASSPRPRAPPATAAIGTCTQEFGTLASWLVDVVNALTGNLDREGGAMFPRSARRPRARSRRAQRAQVAAALALDACAACPSSAASCRRRRSPRRSTPPASSASARSSPSPATRCSRRRTARAATRARGLDFMVSVDIYLNETTRHADVILPPVSPLERSNYDIAFHQLSVRNTAKYSPPVLEPPDGRAPAVVDPRRARRPARRRGADAVDELVLSGLLASTVGGAQTVVSGRQRRAGARRARRERGPERHPRSDAARGPVGRPLRRRRDGLSLAKLRADEHGIDLGPLEPRLPDLLSHARAARSSWRRSCWSATCRGCARRSTSAAGRRASC